MYHLQLAPNELKRLFPRSLSVRVFFSLLFSLGFPHQWLDSSSLAPSASASAESKASLTLVGRCSPANPSPLSPID